MGNWKADVNGDQFITGRELMSFVSTNMENYRTVYPQSPQYGWEPRTSSGDFVFGPLDPTNLQATLPTAQVSKLVTPAKVNPCEAIRNLPTSDSGWIGGGSSPGGYCQPILVDLQSKFPECNVQMTLLPEQHRSEYTPFKHDYYRYQCSFSATPK